MGCHFLLQGIFPTQGLNPRLLCLLHWQAGSLPLAPPGKPMKLLFQGHIDNVDVLCPDLEYERKGNNVLDFAEKTSQDIPLLDLNML